NYARWGQLAAYNLPTKDETFRAARRSLGTAHRFRNHFEFIRHNSARPAFQQRPQILNRIDACRIGIWTDHKDLAAVPSKVDVVAFEEFGHFYLPFFAYESCLARMRL
ncbi:hypothetical protein, partial [Rhizobium nepotum]